MKLHEMTLDEVLRGLELVQNGYGNVLCGNDVDRTKFIKNITKDMYESLVNFDLEKLNEDFYESETYGYYKAGEIIRSYIIPVINKAKERYEKYGF